MGENQSILSHQPRYRSTANRRKMGRVLKVPPNDIGGGAAVYAHQPSASSSAGRLMDAHNNNDNCRSSSSSSSKATTAKENGAGAVEFSTTIKNVKKNKFLKIPKSLTNNNFCFSPPSSRKTSAAFIFPFLREELTPLTRSIHGDYKISSKAVLGIGFNGKVVECVRKKVGQKCALKVLKDSERARSEAELHWLVSECPNIVTMLDVYDNQTHRTKYILMVMEYMNGGELFSRIKDRVQTPLTEREVANIMFEICSAVEYLHNANIAHRDIKPENLLYSSWKKDAVLKLTDFGFAKRVDSNDENSLRTPCFTPYYVPPEILGSEKYDKSCDIWSLGVVMYILLCGFPPFMSFHGLAMSPGMRHKIRTGNYKFPSPSWDVVSDEAKELIKGLLKVVPNERLSIGEVIHHPWIENRIKVPETPLLTADVLLKEQTKWHTVKEEFANALICMRIDYDQQIKLKPINQIQNGLLEKRRIKLLKPIQI